MSDFLKLATGDYLLLVDGTSKMILQLVVSALRRGLLLIGVGK